MIQLDKLRETVANGLKSYIGVPVIRGNQASRQPKYPFASYNVITISTQNNGTWQKHDDGIDRKLVRSVFSFSFLSNDYIESVILASKAREWFDHTGHTWLSDNGIIVQSITDITNRDNILTVDYERKNGFDVFFYVFDEAESHTEYDSYIKSVETDHYIEND